MISSSMKLSFAVIVLGSLVACASPKAGTTTVTSADAPASEKSAPSSISSSPAAETKEASETNSTPAPEGDLVCRAVTNDGTTELYLKWNDGEAKGTVRSIAPSGNVYDQRVVAQRYKGRIIADEPGNQDLVKHAAVISEENGKMRIRIEDMGSVKWLDCN